MSTETFTGYRFYTITEELIPEDEDGKYSWIITVSDCGNVIDRFVGPTRRTVLTAMKDAGYVKVRDNR